MKKTFLILLGFLFLFSCTKRKVEPLTDSKKEDISTQSSKYKFVLYNDNTGQFLAPNGGRICSFKLSGGRTEVLKFTLNRRIQILGYETIHIYLSRNRLFADYGDYLQFFNDYDSNKTLDIPVESHKDGEKEFFYFDLDSSQIEQMDIKPLNISFGDEYTLIEFNDKSAVLYDAFGKHICNINDVYYPLNDAVEYNLPHNITMFGNVRTDELIIYKSKLYTDYKDFSNVIFSSTLESKVDKRRANIQKREEGDVIIYTFPTTALPPKPIERKT